RVARQVDLSDELPAAGPVLAADPGIAPALGLVVADRGRAHRCAALDDVLVDPGALGRHEPFPRVPDPMTRLGEISAVLQHRPGDALELVALLGEPDGPWILQPLALPVTGRRGLGDQPERLARHEGRCAGDRRGLLAGPPRGPRADVGDREEAPARADQRTHADAGPLRAIEALDHPVPGAHGLG